MLDCQPGFFRFAEIVGKFRIHGATLAFGDAEGDEHAGQDNREGAATDLYVHEHALLRGFGTLR